MTFLKEAEAIRDEMIQHRRYIHSHAEVGLDLPNTSAYVEKVLKEMGCEPVRIGQSGVTALIGGKKPGKVFMLRADMDALPLEEDSGLDFACKDGAMHACGHDMHTTILLGAAKLLKAHEDEIDGTIKLMFQPGEELFAGAKMMIEEGILENPPVDAALSLHVSGSSEEPAGTIILPNAKKCAASAADWFKITVKGSGSHGAFPQTGVDPLNVVAHLHTALQEINAREISGIDTAIITVGEIHGGTVPNVIPDTATMRGTIRTLNNDTREFVKKRLVEISKAVAATFRAEAEVEFDRECPCFELNKKLLKEIARYTKETFDEEYIVDNNLSDHAKDVLASEDFAWVSIHVPSVIFNVGTGSPEEGYLYPVHHPKVVFDEKALVTAPAMLASVAVRWLEEH